MPEIEELGNEELREIGGGLPWIFVPLGWIAVEIAMNPKTTAEVFTAAAEAELAKIKQEYN